MDRNFSRWAKGVLESQESSSFLRNLPSFERGRLATWLLGASQFLMAMLWAMGLLIIFLRCFAVSNSRGKCSSKSSTMLTLESLRLLFSSLSSRMISDCFKSSMRLKIECFNCPKERGSWISSALLSSTKLDSILFMLWNYSVFEGFREDRRLSSARAPLEQWSKSLVDSWVKSLNFSPFRIYN